MISSKKVINLLAVIALVVIGLTLFLFYVNTANNQNKKVSMPTMIQEYTKDKSDVKLTIGVLKAGKTNFKVFGLNSKELEPVEARIVGESGSIFAVDLWSEMLDKICEDAKALGIHNIHPVVSDIRKKIEVSNASMDVCLISTVLHMMDFLTETDRLFAEIKRILKPGGKLAIIECEKENSSFGPSINLRISPEELEKGLVKFGLSKIDYIDLGANLYGDVCFKSMKVRWSKWQLRLLWKTI